MTTDAVAMIDDASQLNALCERVAQSAHVALDTEFHTERTYAPRLMVVQLAFDDGAVIVDPLAVPDLRPLLDALAQTVVVGHALSSDLKIFADRFDRVPANVFDSQVAAAFLGYGMQISLADLVRELEGVRLAKSQTVSDWSTRPLSHKQLDYLVDDVAHLLPMHQKLTARLEAAGRLEWAREECDSARRHRALSQRRTARIPAYSGRDAHEPARTRRAERTREVA